MLKLTNNEENVLKDLEGSITKELEGLTKLDNQTKKEKNDDIKTMIKYYIDMTNNIEDRRNRIYNFTLQLLSICLAGLGLIISQRKNIYPAIFLPVTLFFLVQILGSLLIVILYLMQSGFRYNFLEEKLEKYGNKWKWFYYGNKEVRKLSANAIFKSKKFHDTVKPYLSGLKNFVNNYKMENIDVEISENIQQLYLLLVHNYYKNRFYLQLNNIQKKSIILTIIFIIIGVILYAFFN
jgi:hypothetical protein